MCASEYEIFFSNILIISCLILQKFSSFSLSIYFNFCISKESKIAMESDIEK